MRNTLSLAALAFVCLTSAALLAQAQDKKPDADPLAADLKLLQGKWEMLHGKDAKGEATIHSVKEINGNEETLRRYDIKTGKLTREHTVAFTLSASGDVRVFTFYPVGGEPKQGASFVYKVDAEDFYDIPGLLHGDTFRNYQPSPTVWHWKRVKETEKKAVKEPKDKDAKDPK
jgi:hypothetical protein